MTDKQIKIDMKYYKELFKAFYNKRFKNVKETEFYITDSTKK